jgi:histidyl-tRNA synthetase
METPCVEHIENLNSKSGGENEKLIFKILKRGEKLRILDEAKQELDLVDGGLRYDLTVPLCRYYSNNAPSFRLRSRRFRWAASGERTGRREDAIRQFMQCDIDILGSLRNLLRRLS